MSPGASPSPPGGAARNRRELLGASLAAAAAVAVTATPRAAAAGSGPADGTAPDPPAARLRRLISVELLLLYCYEHVLTAPFVSARARPVLTLQARHEQDHLQALTAELRRLAPAEAPPAGPATPTAADRALAHRNVSGRLGQLKGEKDALHLLLELERVVGGAYFVALTKLSSPRLIELTVSVMAAEAQHEALLGDLLYPGHPDQAVPYGLIQGIQ